MGLIDALYSADFHQYESRIPVSFNSIVINNKDSTHMATEYPIAKDHWEISYLKGEFRITPFQGRLKEISRDDPGIKKPESHGIFSFLSVKS